MMINKPEQHVTWSIIVIVFSILSWFGAAGGFIIGFILGLIGGILGLVWKPKAPYPSAPPSAATLPIRVCPNCGRQIAMDAKFCPHCGKPLP